MTDNTFQLAAALMTDAADFVGRMPLGQSRLRHHPYGDQYALGALHTQDTTGAHMLTLIAVDDAGSAALVEATLSTPTAVPATRIVGFRVDTMIFSGLGDWTFLASSDRHTYTLTAHIGANSWDLSIDGELAAAYDTIDTAADALARHNTATAR